MIHDLFTDMGEDNTAITKKSYLFTAYIGMRLDVSASQTE